MVKLLKQLNKMCMNYKLSKLDIRVYLYMQLHCRKYKTFAPYLIGKELRVSVGAVVNSYARLKAHELIKEISKAKIGPHWVYDFEFGA